MLNNDLGRATAYRPSDLLNDVEAASFLTLAPTTLRNWRYLGQGPVVTRVGKRAVRYRYSDLQAFIATSTVEAA